MIAVVPLIVFLSGFFTSMAIPFLSKKLEHNFIYIIGGVFMVSSLVWAYYIADPIPKMGAKSDPNYEIIGVAVVCLLPKNKIALGRHMI